jgi:glycosyltransferase involved in cell wall biosynthesis
MVHISGFTIVRNAIRYDYPFRESIQSLLPLVDELIVAVGDSCDGTRQAIDELGSNKLRMIDTVWDPALRSGGAILAQQTNVALEHCQGEWCFYLQADEVLHEVDREKIRRSIDRASRSSQVDSLSFRYRHFCADYSIVDPIPYRSQVRIIRNGRGIRSVGDACGFAKADGELRTRPTGAWVYHYGYVRPPDVLAIKTCYFESLYANRSIEPGKEPEVGDFVFDLRRCQLFRGSHPSVMQHRIANKSWPTPHFRPVPWYRNPHFVRSLLYKNTRALRRWKDRFQRYRTK